MLNKKRYIVPVLILMFPIVLSLAVIRHAASFLFRALKPKNYPPVLRYNLLSSYFINVSSLLVNNFEGAMKTSFKD